VLLHLLCFCPSLRLWPVDDAVRGSDDPWQRASVNKQISEDMPYCYMECDGCGHCGSGVPAGKDKCLDVQTQYLDLWLGHKGAAKAI
jgi:hypothetical protein